MKKIISIIFVLVLIVSATACGKSNTNGTAKIKYFEPKSIKYSDISNNEDDFVSSNKTLNDLYNQNQYITNIVLVKIDDKRYSRVNNGLVICGITIEKTWKGSLAVGDKITIFSYGGFFVDDENNLVYYSEAGNDISDGGFVPPELESGKKYILCLGDKLVEENSALNGMYSENGYDTRMYSQEDNSFKRYLPKLGFNKQTGEFEDWSGVQSVFTFEEIDTEFTRLKNLSVNQ